MVGRPSHGARRNDRNGARLEGVLPRGSVLGYSSLTRAAMMAACAARSTSVT